MSTKAPGRWGGGVRGNENKVERHWFRCRIERAVTPQSQPPVHVCNSHLIVFPVIRVPILTTGRWRHEPEDV